ncbi:MAG: c-type cytochrome [Planctomycetes bacterium]|nr:c-type cytochrome [Planctomycetota bacterium]
MSSLLIAGVLTCVAALAHAADQGGNVTTVVAAEVKNGHLSLAVGNDRFGDTAPGVPKKLRVEYRVGSAALVREVPEGGQLDLTAPAGQTLTILKAVYGPADGTSTADVAEDPSAVLATLPGFAVEHVLRADRVKNGSWICMAKDGKGRLLLGGQRGQPITRVTLLDGKVAKQEVLHIPVSETMGMLFVDNVLYLNGQGAHGFALYRCKDTKGDDSYDDVEFLREWHGGAGEHGAHALLLGPDRKLYAVCGNFTAIPQDLAPSSPHRVYGDDLALKRMEDGNGFGAGNPPPGGFVARMDLDGGNAELFASGERNTYDIAFNADGELFGFDSDMEWDWGSPWYRPTRVYHAVRGADQGFREGSGKWPEYYPDSLPAAVTIGIGCPTGVGFGTGAKFPPAYQQALFICDWTYGRLMAVHLNPDGATYGGSWEDFVAPKSMHTKQRKAPLNLTDELIGDDGAMYFTTGGRGTVSDLFRVTYTGNVADVPGRVTAQNAAECAGLRDLRHTLEAFNVKPDPAAVGFAWPHLGSADRFVRYAARLAIERNPVAEWQALALAEKRPDAALTALLALARLGAADTQPAILRALADLPVATLGEAQQLDLLRVIEVSIARQGVPSGDVAHAVSAGVDPLYPAKSEFLNRELCQVLLALDAPGAVARTVALLKAAPTQEEQLTYVVALRSVKSGWTPELRRSYLSWWDAGRSNQHPAGVVQWFTEAGIGFNNGSSFTKLLSHALSDAKAAMTPEELAAVGDAHPQAATTPSAPLAAVRAFVQDWKTADLQPLLDQVSKGRNFARGKAAFTGAQCILCHRYGDQGGAVGPDLTAVATRFKRQDLLESITEPSKVISEQFATTVFTMKDGSVLVGRVIQDADQTVMVAQNPFAPQTTPIAKADIKSRDVSKVSLMPPGLLNTFTKDEILDLLAFLESMGDPQHPDFSK